MAIEDLDLEFEDEEEKKGDALEVDADLSFAASPGEDLSKKPRKVPLPKSDAIESPSHSKQRAPTPKVANINEARPRAQLRGEKPVKSQQQVYANDDNGQLQIMRNEIEALKGQIRSIEHQADVKVAVAQAEKDFLIEYISNAKVLDHQVTQILQRINKKVPALASEAQTIKKYMNEFLKKSIPKKKGETE